MILTNLSFATSRVLTKIYKPGMLGSTTNVTLVTTYIWIVKVYFCKIGVVHLCEARLYAAIKRRLTVAISFAFATG